MSSKNINSKAARLGTLELVSTIGFEGKVPGGLKLHPDKEHLVYPLGNTVVICNLKTKIQAFLSGHNKIVSCLEVSKSGKYLASGQVSHMGFKAAVIVWDFQKRDQYGHHDVHKMKVEAVAFSPSEQYLVSLGGIDDGNVVVWDMMKKEPLCGCAASEGVSGSAHTLAYGRVHEDVFVTGGKNTLRVWKLDCQKKKIHATNLPLGKIKRHISCIMMDAEDLYFYCGTTTGDVLKVWVCSPVARVFQGDGETSVNPALACCLAKKLRKKEDESRRYSNGITSLVVLKSGELLIGAGDGTVAQLLQSDHVRSPAGATKTPMCRTNHQLEELQSVKVSGAVTSLMIQGNTIWIGCASCQIYSLKMDTFSLQLLHTCHPSPINDIIFPDNCSELFATCGGDEIRIWNSSTCQELLRISTPNMTCLGIVFMHDGSGIISAWDDGKVRAFTPESGQVMFTIHNAHNRGVTAVATTRDGKRIVTGGGEGQVRVWDLLPNKQVLHEAMKEHKGSVSSIQLRKNDKECVSASTDGTCIIWDLQRFIRNQIIFANTLFMCVCYHPEECQIITSGSDRKIGYWEVYDGSQIRELEGSRLGSINSLHITNDGLYFVTAGCDKIVKVWDYNKGEVTHIGQGHSGEISRLRISPDNKHIFSVSKDGAILKWKFPK